MLVVEQHRENIALSRVGIIGVGGGAGHVIDRLARDWDGVATLASINCDTQALEACAAPLKVQIGKACTNGVGTGCDAELGQQAAEKDEELIRGLIGELDMIILVTCLGGGLGTGATPVILRMIRESSAMPICFATLPFGFEGVPRATVADAGLRQLHANADTLVVMPNERLVETLGGGGVKEAFTETDRLLSSGIRTLCTMIATEGAINIDFGDLRRVVQHSGGTCSFGFGEGHGDNRVADAVKSTTRCPLLVADNVLLEAESVLVGLVGGPQITLHDVGAFMDGFSKSLSSRAHVSMGMATNESMGDTLTAFVLTGETWGDGSAEARQYELQLEGIPSTPGTRKRRRKRKKATQTKLELGVPGKGRFKNVAPTMLDGEDLDLPTFVRRGILIER